MMSSGRRLDKYKRELVKSPVCSYNGESLSVLGLNLAQQEKDCREYLNDHNKESLKLPMNVCDPKAPSKPPLG